jgi:hypothetical protein
MKQTKATIQQRVEEVLQVRLAGAEFWEIRQYASEKEWDVSDRQLWRYVKQSDAVLAEQLEQDRDKLLNRHLAQRRTIFARCMSTGDYRGALSAARDEAELLSLYPAKQTKVEHRGKDGGPIEHEMKAHDSIFERIQQYADAFATLAEGDVHGDGAGKPLDPAPPHEQAGRIPDDH